MKLTMSCSWIMIIRQLRFHLTKTDSFWEGSAYYSRPKIKPTRSSLSPQFRNSNYQNFVLRRHSRSLNLHQVKTRTLNHTLQTSSKAQLCQLNHKPIHHSIQIPKSSQLIHVEGDKRWPPCLPLQALGIKLRRPIVSVKIYPMVTWLLVTHHPANTSGSTFLV